MPNKPTYGDRIALGLGGRAQVVAVPAAKSASPPIQPDRWVRNGKHPNAQLMNLMSEAANQAVLYRSKEVFSGADRIHPFRSISSVSTDRVRWRWAFHTGPLTHALYAVVVMRPPNSGYTHNTYSRIDISNGAGSIVATRDFVYGVEPTNGTGVNGAWPYYKVVTGYIEGVAPDTDYYGVLTDIDYGRALSCTVFDLQSLSENFNGYLPQNVGTHSAVIAKYRENIVTILNDLWRKGAAQVFNWSVNDGTSPQTNATNTFKNIVDASTTTVSAASPGYTLKMNGKDRLSQSTGVPVVMKACGFNGVGAATTGTIKLVDSSGATVMSITNGWSATSTPNWQSTTGVLPATTDKYDLLFSNNGGGTFSLCAVSVYEKD